MEKGSTTPTTGHWMAQAGSKAHLKLPLETEVIHVLIALTIDHKT